MVASMPTVPDKSVEMLLRGRCASVRLSILRYQFPHITTGEYDANWLIIRGHVSLDDRSWTFSDPSLTTFEALRRGPNPVIRGTNTGSKS